MSDTDTKAQLVTFQLGKELYGVDIMEVQGIVELTEIRPIPTAPKYVAGILNLRGEIVPIIDLHKRFNIQRPEFSEEDHVLSGYMIINFDNIKLGIIIDRIVKVVSIGGGAIQPPPQALTGIGKEYIQGVAHLEEEYLVILDIRKLFSSHELQQLHSMSR